MALQAQTVLPFAWAEYVSAKGSTSNASFGWGGGTQAAMTIDVPWASWADAGNVVQQYLLGTAWRADSYLKRILPWAHPLYENLYCTRISNVMGVKWDGKEEQTFGPVSAYDRVRLTLLFESLPYNVLGDEDLAGLYAGYEGNRYVTVERVPAVEAISRQGSAWKFQEGPSSGVAVPFAVSQLLSKVEIKLTWHQVPEDYLLDAANKSAVKIEAILGKVNGATFMGYPAETLLCHACRVYPVPAPFPVSGQTKWEPQRLWNAEVVMKYFAPNFGGANQHGHNSVPDISDGKWYLIKDAGANTRTLYESADFADIFEGV